ncbi:MAG: CPBP family intramembrane metalloprotease [bacterium]|nr:CPBP family intramembrane metalloprotease [bacterium]
MSAAEEEDWDEDDWEDEGFGPDLAHSLPFGFLAILPLVVAYELGVRHTGGLRSAAELTLFRPTVLLGEWADVARWTVLAAGGVWALVHCARRHWALGPRVMRVVLEGAAGAVLIGPVLIAVLRLLGDLPPLQLASSEFAPRPSRAAFVCGAAAYEELLFRVGLYSVLFLLTNSVVRFLGIEGAVGRLVADGVALVGSSALFACSHLAVALSWLGSGGEEFDLAIFTWRAGAGILLGLLFRLRGVGVAAWTHAFFNLALLLGAGPEVFL